MKAIAVLVVLALAVTVAALEKPKRASTLVPPKISEKTMSKADIHYVKKGESSRNLPNGEFNKAWLSPAVDLVPMLQMAPGAVCAPAATNIRASPSTSARVLFVTVAGEQLHVTGTQEVSANSYVWVPVNGRNQNGWVAKTLIAGCPTAPTSTSTKWPLYKQCGQSWSPTHIGLNGCPKTICQVGCAMSSVSMILKGRGVDTDPGRLNAWLQQHGGYSSCSLYWGAVDKLGKTKCLGFVKYSFAQLCAAVASGKGVVLNVNAGAHWVLATGCDKSNNVIVNDPGYTRTSYPFSGVVNMVAYQ